MLCTFPYGIHPGSVRLHIIIYNDAAVDLNPAFAGQFNIRFNADGHYNEVRFSNFSVGKQQAFDSFFAEDRFRLFLQEELHPLLFQLFAEHH
ncbi:hypothetical protein D3C86_1731360 [compost metagenome]